MFSYDITLNRKENKNMEIISILNLKGGVSKTTTTQNLASALRQLDKKVLTIDLDYQCNLTQILNSPSEFSSYDIFNSDAVDINKLIVNDNINASKNLLLIDKLLNDRIGKEHILKEALEPLKSVYDYVLIDNHAIINTITINSLTASNKVIIPTNASYLSLEGINELYKNIEAIKKYTNKQLSIGGFILTKYNPRTNLSKGLKDNLEAIAKAYKTKVYKTYIRQNNAIEEAQALKQDLFTYNKKSNGAIDYLNLAKEIIEEWKGESLEHGKGRLYKLYT